MSAPADRSRRSWKRPVRVPGYFLFLFIFGAGAWIANAAVCVSARLGRPARPEALRARIQRLLQAYLRASATLCDFHVQYEGWPDDWQSRLNGTLLIANHPSLLDAPILLARSSRLICLYKAALGRTLLWPTMAGRAGYLSNEGGIDAVRAAVGLLKDGGTLLLFPEGTRSRGGRLGRFESGGALIAARADAPVQLILIRMSSPLLTKEISNLRPPRLPATATVRWGPCLRPHSGESFRAFNSRLETAFQSALTPPK